MKQPAHKCAGLDLSSPGTGNTNFIEHALLSLEISFLPRVKVSIHCYFLVISHSPGPQKSIFEKEDKGV